MKLSFQEELLKIYPMLGIDPSMPYDGIQPGLKVPDWINKGPLYEIFLRNFTREGSFSGAEKRLGYLKDLGVKTIWLMPIHPIGKEKRKGKLGSPYAILDHMVINPDYGSKSDFRHLVDAVHDHDMRIIIDMVLNHGAVDHSRYVAEPEMFNNKFLRSPGGWSDIREFNYNSQETNEYASDVLRYWVQEFGIDGYRCDVAGLVPRVFWEKSVEQLLDIKPDLYLLAEWQNRALPNRSFHSIYDWTLYSLMKEIYLGNRSAQDLLTWERQVSNGYPENARLLKFTENHDFPRTVKTFGKNRFLPFAAFTYFVQGIPLIYNGQELGFETEPSLFEQGSMDWNAKDEQVYEFYQRLIHIRYKHQSVFEGNLEILMNDRPEKIITFLREDENDKLLIILNFCDEQVAVKIDLSETIAAGSFLDLISETQVEISHGNVKVRPNQVLVLK